MPGTTVGGSEKVHTHFITPSHLFVWRPVVDCLITCLFWGYSLEAGALIKVVLLLAGSEADKGYTQQADAREL